MNTKELFRQWLSDNATKELNAEIIIKALDDASDYCCSRNISKVSFWDITDKNDLDFISCKLLGMRTTKYRLTHRNTAVVLDKALPLYQQFLQHNKGKLSSKFIVAGIQFKKENNYIEDIIQSENTMGIQLDKKTVNSQMTDCASLEDRIYTALKSECETNLGGVTAVYLAKDMKASEQEVESVLNSAKWAKFEYGKYMFFEAGDESLKFETMKKSL